MSVKMRKNLCQTKQASNIDSKKFTTINFAIFSLAVYRKPTNPPYSFNF